MSKRKNNSMASALAPFQSWRDGKSNEKSKPLPQGRTVIPKPERLIYSVEFFESNTRLNSSIPHTFDGDGRKVAVTDRQRDLSNDDGKMRREWARRFRDIVDGSQITPLRSPDFGGLAGGSFGSKTPPDHAIDCGRKVGEIQQRIPALMFKLLTVVFIEDKFVWEKDKAAFLEIRMALDYVGWCLGELKEEDLARRWPVSDDYRIRSPKRWAAGFDTRVAQRRAKQSTKPALPK